jgi:peptide/nickel transport system substrate-binding protein
VRPHPIHWLTLIALTSLAGALGLVCAHPQRMEPQAGVVRVGLDAEPKTLDPHATTALNDFRVLANVYEGLVRFADDRLEVVPGLAERWSVSDDGRVVDFVLRRGVRFHDGSVFDAHAVRFNLERLTDPTHPFHQTGPFPLASFFESIERVEQRSPGAVRLVLKRPFAPLLSNLAYPIGFMVSPSAVRRFGAEFGRHGGGTGPFQVESWQPGRAIVLARNERYWGARPELARVVFRPLADPMTRVAELRTGGIDVLPEVAADTLPFFRRTGGARILSRTGPHLWFLILNTRRPPFDDLRARRAVNYALDKQQIVERVLGGTASVAAGAIPDAFGWARARGVAAYPFDPPRARQLLRDSGARSSKLRLIVPSSGSGMLEPELLASAIQADLARVGLEVEIRTYEWNAYLAEVNAGLADDVQMAAMAWMTNDPDTLPYLALRSGARPPAGFNSGWYQNHELDALLERARAAVEAGERASLYHAIDRLIHDQAPWLFVASWRQMTLVRERVVGLSLEPSFFLRFDRARTR